MALTPVQELEAIRAELDRRGHTLSPESILSIPDTSVDGINLHGIPDYTNYADNLNGFIQDVLKSHLWSKQREIVESVQKNQKTTVRSSHGVGKTYVASRCATAFLYTHPNSLVITTAPAARSVADQIWREIRECINLAGLPGRCLTTKLELSERWFATGFSTDDASKFQGYHAADVLLIVDEAAGVEQTIYDAADGILTTTGSRQLLIGNPTTTSGKFYDSHHKMRGYWNPIHINCFMSPNYTGEEVPKLVKDHLVAATWAEERALEWGEDSPLYQVRVVGNFCDLDDSGLIPLSWIEKASEIAPEAAGQSVLGADIARQGACETAVYVRQGFRIVNFEAWRNSDLNYTTNRIAGIMRKFSVKKANIDATGMGVGVIDSLKAAGWKGVNEIHVGSVPNDKQLFVMLRDEIWWNLRGHLRDAEIGPLTDEKTKAQLCTIRYFFDKKGRIEIENKKKMMERRMPSPDRADALALWFAPAKTGRSRKVWAW